jgi:SAM-dependent methyltransferase
MTAAPPCAVCGATGTASAIRLVESMFATREAFGYHRCDACGSLTIDSVPADLARHYPAAYFERSRGDLMSDADRWTILANRILTRPALFDRGRRLARLVRLLRPTTRPAKPPIRLIRAARLRDFDDPILDVGCGLVPRRLDELRVAGFTNLHGLEPFAPIGTSFRGIPIHRGSIGALPGAGTWAYVTFHHSLEHVPDPFADLAAAARLLRPGGICLVRTPMMGTAMWERYREAWVELDPPRHLFVFSEAGLTTLARRAGLGHIETVWEGNAWELIVSEQYRHGLGMYEPGSWMLDPASSGITEAQVEAFQREAVEMAHAGRSGRAALLFERPE